MGRKPDSTYRVQTVADPRGSQFSTGRIRPSAALVRHARRNRTADVGRVSVIDPLTKNIGLAGNVIDDFPDAVPETSRELEVIETYLGAALEEIFGIAHSNLTNEITGETKWGKGLGLGLIHCEDE